MLKIYVRKTLNHVNAQWYEYKIFNPTGRWKLEIRGNKTTMFLEHKSFLFKDWIDDIVFQWEETFINECGKL